VESNLSVLRHSPSNRCFESLSTARAPLLRLFCFPYAGGNAYAFREWQQHLAPEIDVCLGHLPGRARRIGERHTQMQSLVAELVNAIRTEIHGRFAFFGHSMGALVSFELVRELRRRNYSTPLHLFLSACRAPTVMKAVPPTFNLPTQEFLAELQKLKGTPQEFFQCPEIQNSLLPLLRADFEVTDTYNYIAESPLSCPITVYGGEHDNLAPVKNLAPWEFQTSAQYQIRLFSGDHFFIQSHKSEFLRTLRHDLLQTLCVPRSPTEFTS